MVGNGPEWPCGRTPASLANSIAPGAVRGAEGVRVGCRSPSLPNVFNVPFSGLRTEYIRVVDRYREPDRARPRHRSRIAPRRQEDAQWSSRARIAALMPSAPWRGSDLRPVDALRRPRAQFGFVIWLPGSCCGRTHDGAKP